MTTTADGTENAALGHFHACSRTWFVATFDGPTEVQTRAWPVIAAGRHSLLLAPTGSGKTLAAFLVAVDRLMFEPRGDERGVRALYVSPLKSLAVDVERNLQPPIAGIGAVAAREGVAHHVPRVAIRSGDTPSTERARIVRNPPDILITTPESLYLLLTSRAREILRTVDAVIVDEIHTMVASKRGAHLFLSLERLEDLRRETGERLPLQRIGLSATQRPLQEVARLLGGAEFASENDREADPVPRPVEVIDAGRRGAIELSIEVPVEDMRRLGETGDASDGPDGPDSAGAATPSIWPSIHPRLVELIRGHRSTMIFVNNRRLAERLATSINELAEEELALAHHGSVAKETRVGIEDRLKRGDLPAIVATSSLELGLDMGAVDLVILIESPPSIASGIQRVGRAGHNVGDRSKAVVFPKFRGDLLACAAASRRMLDGEVEESFFPRNPLDVLAQQIVAIVSREPTAIDDVFATVRRAAPFRDLPHSSFEGVLDLLSGRYPSDEFSELRPRVNWDRVGGMLEGRTGAQRVAVLNAGTIPDRGLFGVFLADDIEGTGRRVGELDEEMVFETRPGDVFLLGASSWRVVDITHDRVLVVPAPGEPGRMPFWRGEGPGRPYEFGRAIGELTRYLADAREQDALDSLSTDRGLDERAARNLLTYVRDQATVTGEVPSDRTIVVERFLDEIGDWRVCVLTPFGSRVHAPWATAVAALLRESGADDVDVVWTDDGMVFRLPEGAEPPGEPTLFPSADEIEDIVVRELGTTAFFAGRFRENAARALLLPRRRPGKRSPLWLQRKRSADLLAVASRFESFPILLETYRECLRDVFDLPALKRVLRDVRSRAVRTWFVETPHPSPFASSLLFEFVGNFLYDGDAPLAERRAQTLALDHAQLRELLGDAELRELLDPVVVEEVAIELQRLGDESRVRSADGLHDLLLRLGDLTRDEIAARCESAEQSADWTMRLLESRRAIEASIGGEPRVVAAEDAARVRDALGGALPTGLPDAFLEPVAEPVVDLVSRYARTHVPFTTAAVAARLGLGVAVVRSALQQLASRDRVLEGEFLPGGREREWCDADVLRRLKRRSLARLRQRVEPVEEETLGRFLPEWQGVSRPRTGLDGVLDVVEQLQALPLPASTLELEILPARVKGFRPGDLDELCVAGEVVWQGVEALGATDGRVALYLTDSLPLLTRSVTPVEDELPSRIRTVLLERGALFLDEIETLVGGFRNDLVDALWQLVWSGELTNDTLAPLRALRRSSGDGKRRTSRDRGRRSSRFRSRRHTGPAGTGGRWSLLQRTDEPAPTSTERLTARAQQLLERNGVLTREMMAAEDLPGGFGTLYPVLRAMEESGRVRRGYFVSGQGAAQFALPGAEDRLRDLRPVDDGDEHEPDLHVLAATDPANPYGLALRWPKRNGETLGVQRTAGAKVVLRNGALIGYLGRGGHRLVTVLPEDEPEHGRARDELLHALQALAEPGRGVLITTVDGRPVEESPLADALVEAGLQATAQGFLFRDVFRVARPETEE